MKNIYIVFSTTPYKIGKFIRFFTKERFNHISVSFDRNLDCAYTFARRYASAPFFGGLVKDSGTRYFYKNRCSEIAVCRIEVAAETYTAMQNTCAAMHKEEYLYNYFSVAGYIFKRRIFINQAFTCVEFAAYILSFADARINKSSFYTIDGLFDIYRDRVIYSGIPYFAKTDDNYGMKRGMIKSFADTAASIFNLIKRI